MGKPNVGKSTLFVALTMHPVDIGPYPFTTISANRGVGAVRIECPHVEKGLPCSPRHGTCMDGIRYVPVEVIDVAGLVPNAHEGRGLGNRFLDDLRQATVLIHVIDASGSTDAEGNPVGIGEQDPLEDMRFLEEEIAHWIKGIIEDGWKRLARKVETEGRRPSEALAERLSGLGVSERECAMAIRRVGLDEHPTKWDGEDLLALARAIREASKPILVAANKADIAPEELLKRLTSVEGYTVIPVSADYELALKRAAKAGLIKYRPGDPSFEVADWGKLTNPQRRALERILEFMERHGGTGVQVALETAVYRLARRIVVFPVEDENRWTDKEGNVLPDAFLLEDGSTALDLAYRVHTDLGRGFIRAIDGRTHRVLGAEHRLSHGDVIKIVARA